jgi:hypothetical protein
MSRGNPVVRAVRIVRLATARQRTAGRRPGDRAPETRSLIMSFGPSPNCPGTFAGQLDNARDGEIMSPEREMRVGEGRGALADAICR